MNAAPDELVDGFHPLSLEELDERASLQQRVDTKYMLTAQQFEALAAQLQPDYDVLEIDGRRGFGYESVYFDTPGLRCFHDHEQEHRPRFKCRTRLYREASKCVFEVKLKRSDGEMDKRQIDYAVGDREQLTGEARGCVEEALGNASLELDEPLEPTLRTAFERVTLATRQGPERLTCDYGVRMSRFAGGQSALADGLVLVETKSESGPGAADRALAEMGVDAISLSKYKLGIGLLEQGERDPMERFFETFPATGSRVGGS